MRECFARLLTSEKVLSGLSIPQPFRSSRRVPGALSTRWHTPFIKEKVLLTRSSSSSFDLLLQNKEGDVEMAAWQQPFGLKKCINKLFDLLLNKDGVEREKAHLTRVSLNHLVREGDN